MNSANIIYRLLNVSKNSIQSIFSLFFQNKKGRDFGQKGTERRPFQEHVPKGDQIPLTLYLLGALRFWRGRARMTGNIYIQQIAISVGYFG